MKNFNLIKLNSSSNLDKDAKRAILECLQPQTTSKIIGGAEYPISICDAVCYPSEMGHCSCYANLA